ncbi:membrane protein [Oceanobacillus picturae]|uniref:Membrane protein n=1 Tax=Oceanobacillus picturae TaxID=171693 RepID=A0A0U9H884_9BACI|nr:hypothetical protein [Oceanobacillus picturae]GAQ17993.1 membrane protein [Oceanobacillus picturae]
MNQFVEQYKQFRKLDYSESSSFSIVASSIAMRGDHEDLVKVHDYYTNDLIQEWDNQMIEVEEYDNEQLASAI